MKKGLRFLWAALAALLISQTLSCGSSRPALETEDAGETAATVTAEEEPEKTAEQTRKRRAEPDGQSMILNADGSYGGTLDAAKYGEGAPKNGQYDVADSPYYTVNNDFYGMSSTEERLIYPQFASYQQTMQDSDGIACLLMILHYMGEDVQERFCESALVERYEKLNGKSVYGNGTTADGLSRLVRDLGLGYRPSQTGFSITSVSDESKTKMKAFFRNAIRDGKFILVRYQSPNGYRWKVVIGYDTLGEVTNTLTGEKMDSFGDDVIIFADPYDCCDHRQDGYSIERALDFIVWWRNMTVDGKLIEKYSFLVIDPGLDPDIAIEPVDTTVKQEHFENHLPLNPDGTYGGTRNADLYGKIISGRGWWDHPESNYYKINDFYNLGSDRSRIMLPHYTVLQQTMHSSCGVCATTSVLKYYGTEADSYYDLELRFTEDYEKLNNTKIRGKGIGIAGDVKTLEAWGYTVAEYHTDTKPKFRTCEELFACFKSHLEAGRPIVVLINFGSGHYMTVIGVDDMGTDTVYDDVIVTADSSDYWNGCQDGYDVFSAYKFFSQFTNGNYKTLQGFLVIEKP